MLEFSASATAPSNQPKGSLTPKSSTSALELKKDVLLYLIDEENALVPIKFIDQGATREKLEAFKSTLRERHTVDSFVDEGDLVKKLKRDLTHLVSPRPGPVNGPDELAFSKATLAQFSLLPESVAGVEVRLRVRSTGEAYPVSSQACRAFNLKFGATIGVPVTIVLPEGASSKDIFDLFIGEKQVGDLLPLSKGDALDVYAKLHFFDAAIDQLRARFRTKIDYFHGSNAFMQVYGEPVTYQADSAVTIELSRLLAIERSTKPAA